VRPGRVGLEHHPHVSLVHRQVRPGGGRIDDIA
jgi:hypothetical protein